MSTPSSAVAARQSGGKDVDKPIEPTAVSSPETNAAHGMGQILKQLVSNSLAFPTEDSTLEAHDAIDAWVGDTSGVNLEDAIAPIEDVSQRVPPGGGGVPARQMQGAELDYDKLAAAILRAQEAHKK